MDQQYVKSRNSTVHAVRRHFSQNVKITDTFFTNHYTQQTIAPTHRGNGPYSRGFGHFMATPSTRLAPWEESRHPPNEKGTPRRTGEHSEPPILSCRPLLRCHAAPPLLSCRPLGEISPFPPHVNRPSKPHKEMSPSTRHDKGELLIAHREQAYDLQLPSCCHVNPPLLSFRPLGEISPLPPHVGRPSTPTKRCLLPLDMTEGNSCLLISNRLLTLQLPSCCHVNPPLLSCRPLGEISPLPHTWAGRPNPTKRCLLPLDMTKGD